MLDQIVGVATLRLDDAQRAAVLQIQDQRRQLALALRIEVAEGFGGKIVGEVGQKTVAGLRGLFCIFLFGRKDDLDAAILVILVDAVADIVENLVLLIVFYLKHRLNLTGLAEVDFEEIGIVL